MLDLGSRIFYLGDLFYQVSLFLGCHICRLDSLVNYLFALFQVIELVVNRVTLLSQLGYFFVEILNLGVALFAELHDGSLLGNKNFLLVKMLF